jgi:hypothetical protein
MMNGDFHIKIDIKGRDFSNLDSKTFSGPDAVIDAIYYLDTKFNPPAIKLIKKFW